MLLSRLAVVLAVFLAGLPVSYADSPPDLAGGMRQVGEGDFEGAVLTLDAVVRALSTQPERRAELARAHLHLGIAQLALGQGAAARTHFKDALRLEPSLRVGADHSSPKVITAFEAAREDLRREQGGPKKKGVPVVLAAAGGAAAAVGVVLVAGGGEGTGSVSFASARFGTPVVDCPNGSRGAVIPVSLMLEAVNDIGAPIALENIAAVLVIVTSPTFPTEVGIASSRPTLAVPATLPAGQRTTVRLDTTLVCDNAATDPIRFNEWSGKITLTAASRVFTIDAADRLRVNIP